MEPTFWTFSLGNMLTLVGVGVSYLALRHTQQEDREALRRRTQERHEENLESMANIRITIEGMKHLDECIDELKTEIMGLRQQINEINRRERNNRQPRR